MEFGICFKGDMDVQRTLRLARSAEEGGFDYVWAFDSHILWKEAFSMLTLMAANTSRVKLGPLVTNPAVRSLDVAASNFATLNIISEGRALCGIGRGDSSRRMMGKPPATVSRMIDSVEKIRALAEGREVELNGVSVHIPWAVPAYKLPMWLAGYGPNVLRASGRVADGIVLQIAEPSLIKWFIEQTGIGAREAGRDSGDIQYMTAAPVYISDDLEKCRAQCRWFPAMVGNHIADLIKNHSIGVPEHLLEAIHGRAGYNYKKHADKDAGHLDWVSDDLIDGFSVLGTVDMQIAKLKELEVAGCRQFVIYLMCEQEEEIVETYAKEIIPKLRG